VTPAEIALAIADEIHAEITYSNEIAGYAFMRAEEIARSHAARAEGP